MNKELLSKDSELCIIEAFKQGYKLSYNEPWEALTDEANDEYSWLLHI